MQSKQRNRHDPRHFLADRDDRSRLFVNQWLPAAPFKAVILLAHGMAEHSGRYARLAQAFCDQDYGVYAPDLRGHGKTAENGTLGHFADDDGWCKVVSDLASLNQHIGNSILAARSCCSVTASAATSPRPTLHPRASLRGAISAQTSGPWRSLAQHGRSPSGTPRKGRKRRSALIEWLYSDHWTNKFEPARTPFDSLSREPAESICTPMTALRFSLQRSTVDRLARRLQQISKASNLAQIDPGLPLLVMAANVIR